MRCAYQENCEINVITRKFCQKCRLTKCFQIGMKKEWIMSDDARQLKRQRIAENRALASNTNNRRQQLDRRTPDSTTGSPGSPCLASPVPAKRSSFSASGSADTINGFSPYVSNAGSSPCYSPVMPTGQHFGMLGAHHPTSVEVGIQSSSSHNPAAFSSGQVSGIASQRNYVLVEGAECQGSLTSVSSPGGQQAFHPGNSFLQASQYISGGNLLGGGGVGQSMSAGVTDSINIPKDLLLSLLNQCNAQLSRQNMTPGVVIKRECACRCSCGARPGEPLFPPTAEKCVGTDAFVPTTVDYFLGPNTQLDPSMNFLPPGTAENLMFGLEDSVFSMFETVINSEFHGNSLPSPASLGVGGHHQEDQLGGQEMWPKSNMGLTNEEQAKIDELMLANEVMKEPMEKLLGEQHKEQTRLIDVINLTDIGIKRIIKMSKRVSGFKNLCQEDQIALLKGGCTEIMILRGVMSYDSGKDAWHGPEAHYIKCEILKQVKGRNVYEEHKKYLQSFKPEWRTNEPLMLILGAVTLFTPTRARVQQKEIIRMEQNMYYHVLEKYLETQYSLSEARSIYNQLVQKIDELHQLNDNAVRIFLDVNPKDVEPLLIEIFDLKS